MMKWKRYSMALSLSNSFRFYQSHTSLRFRFQCCTTNHGHAPNFGLNSRIDIFFVLVTHTQKGFFILVRFPVECCRASRFHVCLFCQMIGVVLDLFPIETDLFDWHTQFSKLPIKSLFLFWPAHGVCSNLSSNSQKKNLADIGFWIFNSRRRALLQLILRSLKMRVSALLNLLLTLPGKISCKSKESARLKLTRSSKQACPCHPIYIPSPPVFPSF